MVDDLLKDYSDADCHNDLFFSLLMTLCSCSSLIPSPDSLMRRNGLVNRVEFLGLVGTLATV